jgi:hypothetical protein
MRKFIIMLNAVLRHQTPWNPEYSVALPSPFSAACDGAVVIQRAIGTA